MKHSQDYWKRETKRVKVIHFLGATTAASKVTSNQHSNEIQNKGILHIGNNDLRSTLETIGIASNIIDLAKKSEEKMVAMQWYQKFYHEVTSWTKKHKK